MCVCVRLVDAHAFSAKTTAIFTDTWLRGYPLLPLDTCAANYFHFRTKQVIRLKQAMETGVVMSTHQLTNSIEILEKRYGQR